MSDPESLNVLASLLQKVPGVASARVFRNSGTSMITARVRCLDIGAADVLAYCGMAANTRVSFSEIESRLCCENDLSAGLPCDIEFSDEDNELPSECQRFGFFVAKTLYSRGLVDDIILDSLEQSWNVHFGRTLG